MCGIFGFSWEDKELLRKMGAKLIHRGPDQCGVFTDKNISLGHQRLSIIDLSEKGRQPMCNEDGTIWITFNGEIYNFEEIKQSLEKKGHKFASRTDTEVIIHAYEEYGHSCVNLFNGMFAFAIWDSQKEELFLARDRLGEKPIYYCHNSKRFIFASEIKALLVHGIKCEIDIQAINSYLAYKFVPGPLTGFKNILKLQPGHMAVFSKSGLAIYEYWDMQFRAEKNTEEYYIKKASELLNESVKMRLIADVPVGVFLSGGLDSSLITALMCKHQKNVKTFSLGFGDPKHNELKFARQVAEQYSTDHCEITADFGNIRELLPKIIYHLDEPMSDWASVPTYMISKLARTKVKVALAGDGGDELFVGYRQSIINHYSSALKHVPKLAYHWLPESNKAKLAFRIASLNTPIERASGWIKVFHDWERKQVLVPGACCELNTVNQYKDRISRLDQLSQNLYFESKTWLPDDLLMKIDKTTMMVALESRIPFLDHRLVELMCKVPSRMKLSGFSTKYLLKKIAKPYLPRELIYRKKHGFTLPTTAWFRNELKEYANDILSDNEILKILNRNEVEKILRLHQSGKEDFGFKICNLVNFGIWHKIYIQGVQKKELI